MENQNQSGKERRPPISPDDLTDEELWQLVLERIESHAMKDPWASATLSDQYALSSKFHKMIQELPPKHQAMLKKYISLSKEARKALISASYRLGCMHGREQQSK